MIKVFAFDLDGTLTQHKTPLDELKITWVLTNVVYENYEEKEYRNKREKVIN